MYNFYNYVFDSPLCYTRAVARGSRPKHGHLAVNSNVLDGWRMHVSQVIPFRKGYNTYRDEQSENDESSNTGF